VGGARLGDATLSALEVLAITANPDLAATEAQLKQARAVLRQEKASLLPNGKTLAVNAHARTPGLHLGDSGSGGGASDNFDLYTLAFDASWGGDIFGGQRRAIEAARSTAQATQADIADARVTLTAEVEQAYVNVRDRQRGIALNQQSIVMQTQIMELTKERYAHGTASCLDVERLCRDLDRTHADAPARRRARRLS
jgi:outer membrane protein TolC